MINNPDLDDNGVSSRLRNAIKSSFPLTNSDGSLGSVQCMPPMR